MREQPPEYLEEKDIPEKELEGGVDLDCYACAERVYKRLQKARRPISWYITALVSQFLVWIEVGMAFMLTYNTPTIGIGCWSGSIALFGILSTISWLVQFFKVSRYSIIFCHFINFLSLSWLIITIMLIVSLLCNRIHSLPKFFIPPFLERSV
jgi:hypothetical protein